MSELTQKDLRFPVSSQNARKIRGVIGRKSNQQSTLADESGGDLAQHAGTVRSFFIVLEEPLGAGESVTLDLVVDGTTVLPAPFVVDENTPAKAQVEVPVLAKAVRIGDVVAFVRSGYVAGAAVAPANVISAEWA